MDDGERRKKDPKPFPGRQPKKDTQQNDERQPGRPSNQTCTQTQSGPSSSPATSSSTAQATSGQPGPSNVGLPVRSNLGAWGAGKPQSLRTGPPTPQTPATFSPPSARSSQSKPTGPSNLNPDAGKFQPSQQKRPDGRNVSHGKPPAGGAAGKKKSDVGTNTKQVLTDIDAHARSQAAKDPKKDVSTAKALDKYKLSQGFRTAFAATKPDVKILTNYVRLDTPGQLFVYEIEMIRQRIVGSNPIKVGRASDKKKVMRIVSPQIAELANHPNLWVTDNEYIWSTQQLWAGAVAGQQLRQLLTVGYTNECGQGLTVNEVNINFVGATNIPANPAVFFQDPAAFSDRRSNASILIRGLNAFLTKWARTQVHRQTFTGGNKGFDLNTSAVLARLPANDGIRSLAGFFLSARPGIDRLLVNINTATSAFLPNGLTVHDFLTSNAYNRLAPRQKTPLLKGVKVELLFPNPGNLPTGQWNPAESAYRFIHQVGGPMRGQNAQICHRWPLHPFVAANNVTVENCFTNFHPNCQTRVLHPSPVPFFPPNAHAIKVAPSMGRDLGNGYEWIPANLLRILHDQPFHHPLNPEQTTGMIDAARHNPGRTRDRLTQQGMRMFGFNHGTQQGLAALGFQVGTDLLSIPGDFLPAPTVQYGNLSQGNNLSQLSPQPVADAQWNLVVPNTNKKVRVHFAETAAKISLLPFINSTRGDPNNRNGNLARALRELESALREHDILGTNLTYNQKWWPDPSDTNRTIDNAGLDNASETRVQAALTNNRRPAPNETMPILVVIERQSYNLYAQIKRIAELEMGLNTILVRIQTHGKSRFFPQNASNIALKYNFKMAQNTHVLGDNDFAAIRTSASNTDTIVIGADVTHPGKSSNEGCPSVAAVVGSVDAEFMRFPGSMRLQRHKKEYIIELGDMVKERLIDWAEKNGDRLPSRMLFYRDGVSQSQYEKLRSFEIPQIRQAYNWAREFLDHKAAGGSHQTPIAHGNLARDPWPQPHNRNPTPGTPRDHKMDDLFLDHNTNNEQFDLTYVVVGKRHNTRFFPLRTPGPTALDNGNVKPGLVVDQVITHPFSFDFYLHSHNTIIGTGRSAHYFVLQNSMGLRTYELQTVTHDLCYAYSRATKGVSYCAPAYYADRLCDRGRAYLRHWLQGEQNAQYQPYRQKLPNETVPYYHDAIKDNIRDQAYWRPFAITNAGQPQGMKYGFPRRNPWHENMDDIMFYL